ncbi:MAG: sugar-binding protein, partial [Bacteroidales bacterium]
MKRRIFTLFLASLFVAAGFAQKPTAVFKKASVDPVIDAAVDDVWAEADPQNNIDLPFTGEVPTLGASGETTWQGLWTDNGLYIFLRVTDDAFYPNYAVDPPGNNWEYDKPEIYFDVNFILEDGGGAGGGNGHYQVAPGFTDGSNDGTAITEDNGVVYAFLVTGSNYTAEYFIPFSLLLDENGVEVDKMADIGFDVTIIDRDPGDEARRRAVWANTGALSESWNNMDDCGIITLDGAEMPTYIDAITLTGETTITEDNGTSQITAEITPEDASNKVLTWSVENVSGMASVDQDGLVTAIADGEVIVTAAATDGSYEEASLTITISNQVTEMWEVNVIRNGTFADVL